MQSQTGRSRSSFESYEYSATLDQRRHSVSIESTTAVMPKAKSVKAGHSEMVEVVSGTGRPGDKAVLRPTQKSADFSSEGIVDNDVFLLPGSDYQIMVVLTVLAAAVRLFRIYQPSSVVFDEVQ